MARELPRTLFTLQPPYQTGLEDSEIEIIVVDNGSTRPIIIPDKYRNVRYLNVKSPTQSPAAAVNLGLRNATANFIGVMIDGARMASPQLCRFALMASRLDARVVVSTLGYHLGHEVQMQSVLKGYNQEIEDELLNSVPWRDNGYELFRISALAGSSRRGWFSPMAESNALFMPRELWNELGGYEERFQSPGGGYVNLDTYQRACELPDVKLVNLLGEGTFHQVHGGIATNQEPGKHFELFQQEYFEIRGKKFGRSQRYAILLGEVRHEHKTAILESLNIF